MDHSSTPEKTSSVAFASKREKRSCFFRNLRQSLRDLSDCAGEAHKLIIELLAMAALIWLVLHGK
jgi:hypothetical protein